MTGVDGEIVLRTRLETDSTSSGGGPEYRTSQLRFEEEINIITHNYIYHPNFIKLDLGGGLLFNQVRYRTEEVDEYSGDIGYNAAGRMTLLGKKPYPLHLFLDRTNRVASGGLAESFLVVDTKYGFDFSLLPPLSPVRLRVSGYQQEQEGEGARQVIDESIDQLSVRANKSIPSIKWKSDFAYEFKRRDSQSGSRLYPIQKTRTTTHSAYLTSTLFLGPRDQLRFQNTSSFYKQLEFPRRTDTRTSPSIFWRISDSLNLSSSYSLMRSTIEGLKTTNQSARVGLSHRLYLSLFTDLDVHGNTSRSEDLEDRSYGFRGSLSYRKRTFFGSMNLRYSAAFDIYDRISFTQHVSVFGERIVLVGFLPSELRQDNVDRTSVRVFNETRSRQYIEGIDYELTQVGLRTRIQRLLGGDILDGETVLVDYTYSTTGTFKYSSLVQEYGGGFDFKDYLTFYVRFRDESQSLLSGRPTQPLNPARTRLFGARFQYPYRSLLFGAEAELEEHKERISSYDRTNLSASVSWPLSYSTFLRINARRLWVDNLQSPEDVDLIGGDVWLESRPWPRFWLSARAGYERDSGRTVELERWRGRLRAQWSIGRLTLQGEVEMLREKQGETTRDRFIGKFEIRREF